MSQELSATSYALLGLLVFDGPASEGLTGYELKQRADNTLRFYWVSPAMSQVYTELDRLTQNDLVESIDGQTGQRKTRSFRITPKGYRSLQEWLTQSGVDFPILKHPVALRLLMGGLMEPEQVRDMLARYLDQLVARSGDLQAVRDSLGELSEYHYPATVAEWGLDYYASEAEIVTKLIKKLRVSGGDRDADPPGCG